MHKQKGQSRIFYTEDSHEKVNFVVSFAPKIIIYTHQIDVMDMKWSLDDFNLPEATTISELLSELLNDQYSR